MPQQSRLLFAFCLIIPSLLLVMPVPFLRAQSPAAAASQPWARPAEMRGKKLIDTAIYTLDSSPIPINSRTLAENPQFTTTHPFDGIAVRVLMDKPWCDALDQRLKAIDPDASVEPYLDSFLWSREAVPWEVVQEAVRDLNRVQWGSLTDNFLWCNFRGGEKALRADLANDSDWTAIEQNARTLGRICREARLKGLLLDTEQYGNYPNSEDHFPLQRGTPEQRRERGRRWIEALQSECPDVRIIVFFAWSPDLDSAGFLAGVKEFLNGVLEGIREPGKIVHGYENTFYYGQRAGSRFTAEGFRGDRARYEEACRSMRQWRSLSDNPDKYDRFVQVGMAAWIESDPWNLWSGYPSGSRETIWSNVPMAVATTDEYVWCWSEHSNFMHQRAGDGASDDPQQWLNPYIASVTNQTFNRGDEPSRTLDETFQQDPLRSGWYFDFDMLEVGRKTKPEQESPIFTRDAVPYAWRPSDHTVRVQGNWMTGDLGDRVASWGTQRRRFVHPIQPASTNEDFASDLTFVIDQYANDGRQPVLLGMYHTDSHVERFTVSLQARSPRSASLFMDYGSESARVTGPGLQVGHTHRLEIRYTAATRQLLMRIVDLDGGGQRLELKSTLPRDVAILPCDELGAALWDVDSPSTSPTVPCVFRMQSARYRIGSP